MGRTKKTAVKPVKETDFVVQLTVEQLKGVIKECLAELKPVQAGPRLKEKEEEKPSGKEGPTFMGRLLYGIAGIESFFGVSHKTAHQWKESWLKPATKQRGRKIITDAAYALILFSKQDNLKVKAPVVSIAKNGKKNK